jgi:hypothetical protein
VDIYFDTGYKALASTDGSGNFWKIVINALRSVLPGTHWVTGVARLTGASAQAPFLVRTNCSEAGFLPGHGSFNPYENVFEEPSAPPAASSLKPGFTLRP